MNTYVIIYIIAISLLAVFLAVCDKNSARKNVWRVKERLLLAVCVLGGAVAMLITMLALRHKIRRAKFMVGIPLIILVQVALVVFVFDSRLAVTHYEFKTDKIDGQVKFALVADLHSCNYGDGQIDLLRAIDSQNPDAVLLCGDILDYSLPPDKAIEFVKNVSSKYPCYYVSGNHEFWGGTADEFKALIESFGVKVLEGTSDLLEINGNTIVISGIDDPATDNFPSRCVSYAEQLERLREELTDDGLFKVLLSHRPERIEEFVPLNPDIVLSGHAHGGQWRLPTLLENGLLSPNQGLFPKYTNGEYHFNNVTMVVSRGLARESSRIIPRIFNRPEVVILTIFQHKPVDIPQNML
ncbi:MAG: DUF1294 domain-containing protein [Oscillospiraceae bacterium]|nr:DUF1294 domain-containing protein [Oscillospiraceae bacterium]